MSMITIQSRLTASESVRQQLWKLMAQANTPLINELLQQVPQHPDFEKCRQKGKLPATAILQLCQPLKTDPRFVGQPASFYMSAIHVVDYIYKSWLAVQKLLRASLEGQMRWLAMLKSDAELVEISGQTLQVIRTKAAEMLTDCITVSGFDSTPQRTKSKKSQKLSSSNSSSNLKNTLFQAYRETDDIITRCVISYLLKNGCKVSEKEEDLEKFVQRRRKVEIQIERLSEQLTSRIPKGRDLLNTKWLETLLVATNTVPQDEIQAKHWQNILLSQPSSLPFPLVFETNEYMVWSKNQKGRLCVQFNGLSDLTFEVYCDTRQLHWFQRFLKDQQTKRNSKNQHSSSLFTLRNGRLAWQQGQEKGEPWNVNHLTLYCTIDTRLWTSQGTEQVRQEKAAEIGKVITRMKEKNDLSETQQAFIKRKQSTLARIDNSFERPSKPIYQSQSHILVGVSLGLEKPTTVAVVDALADKVLVYQSVHQLLGKNYNLLNRQRRQKQFLAHQRHKAQKREANSQLGESELGQYVDRLLAFAIVAMPSASFANAKTHKASSIVLPKLLDMREIVQSEIQARAEQKCPGYLEAQQKYAKQYRINVHHWSYGRLIENIKSQAKKAGILVEKGQQPVRGSPQEKAYILAISTYRDRITQI